MRNINKIGEKLEGFFWLIILQPFRIKWYFSHRKERKRLREKQKWNYLLHGYKTCEFYWDNEYPHCALMYRSAFYFLWKRFPNYGACKKRNCKNYIHNPVRD